MRDVHRLPRKAIGRHAVRAPVKTVLVAYLLYPRWTVPGRRGAPS